MNFRAATHSKNLTCEYTQRISLPWLVLRENCDQLLQGKLQNAFSNPCQLQSGYFNPCERIERIWPNLP